MNIGISLGITGTRVAGGEVASITATATPATSVLVVGDALNDTTNWATFLNTSNYATDADGETIDTVVVNYIGDTATASEAFADGESNHFSITVTDTGGNERTFTTSARTVIYAAASNSVAPVASGDTSLGDVLSTTNGTWTGATGGAFSYQWRRDGSAISGATSTSYMIVQADSGAALDCVVTYTNSGGAVSADSNDITADTFSAASITGVPTIAGTEAVGSTLTATAATTSGNPTPARTWQWINSASGDISGATSSTYTLQASDEGDTITVRQTETNAIGSDTATSAATGAIAEAPSTSDISALSYTDGTSTVAITASTGDTPLTLYWIIDKKSTTPSGAQIEAGDSNDDVAATLDGSESISVGANSFTEDTSSVPSDTGYYFHAVIKNAGGYGTASTDGPFAVDNTAPTVSYSPADNATDVALDAPLVMTFNEAMDTDATTTVTLKVAGGSTVETFDSATDGTWSSGDTVWTVSPASDFTDGAGLAVQYSGFKDASGNPVAAVANDTTWNFDVVTAASASTSVFTGENGSFSSSPSFSLPVLSAGTYLVFASVLQSGITISGGTLEGTTLGTEIEGLAASDYELACFEVTISGGGNQTLVVNLSGATSNTVVNVVKLASGSSAETQTDSLLGTPPDLDFTFSNTADGEIITFWVGSASSTFSSYDGMTALTAAVSNTEFKSGSALAAVSGGTPVNVGVNFASSFSRALGIAVKVV